MCQDTLLSYPTSTCLNAPEKDLDYLWCIHCRIQQSNNTIIASLCCPLKILLAGSKSQLECIVKRSHILWENSMISSYSLQFSLKRPKSMNALALHTFQLPVCGTQSRAHWFLPLQSILQNNPNEMFWHNLSNEIIIELYQLSFIGFFFFFLI